MEPSATITTVICSVNISEIKENREYYLSSFFQDEEKAELSMRHIRSTAGWYVLKQAVSKLLNQLGHTHLSESDILLSRTDSGRPFIRNIGSQEDTKQIQLPNLFVSITHTRSIAHGMAVHQG